VADRVTASHGRVVVANFVIAIVIIVLLGFVITDALARSLEADDSDEPADRDRP
jgi:hypothetical protein